MKKIVAIVLVLFAIVVTACETGSDARRADEAISEQILTDLQNAHPVPKFARSQLRQNLVELVTAQAQTTQTTTFFFNMGIESPVNFCPSIGFPIPATAQLTNPQQKEPGRGGGNIALPQVEPTGVYTGDTTGTYVMCIDGLGQAYAVYWEGFVQSITGPAAWTGGRIELIGPPSFNFSEGG